MSPDANANADADADADANANRSKTICRPPLKGVDIIIELSMKYIFLKTLKITDKEKKPNVAAKLS